MVALSVYCLTIALRGGDDNRDPSSPIKKIRAPPQVTMRGIKTPRGLGERLPRVTHEGR